MDKDNQDATLRDTVVAEESTETKVEESKVESKTEVDPAILELGTILANAGVTKENVNDIIAAPQALNALRYAIQNDPEEFLKMIERSDPKSGENLLEKMSDVYLKRNEGKLKLPVEGDKGKAAVPDELMQKIAKLEEETTSLRNEKQREQAAMAQAATQQRYKARLDDVFNIDQIKKMELTPSEIKNMKARVGEVMAADPSIVQRASAGNFVDLPGAFKTVLEELVADKKAATEAQTKARERSKLGAFADFLSGPNAQLMDIPQNTFDTWDATEDGFAKALEALSR